MKTKSQWYAERFCEIADVNDVIAPSLKDFGHGFWGAEWYDLSMQVMAMGICAPTANDIVKALFLLLDKATDEMYFNHEKYAIGFRPLLIVPYGQHKELEALAVDCEAVDFLWLHPEFELFVQLMTEGEQEGAPNDE